MRQANFWYLLDVLGNQPGILADQPRLLAESVYFSET